jgi:transmembrane sensor
MFASAMTGYQDRRTEREALRRQAMAWLVRLSSGETTAADAEALRRWCDESPAHAVAFAEANLLWKELGPAARNVAARTVVARSAPERTTMARRAFIGGAAAAAAAGVGCLMVRPPLDLWPSVSELAAEYRTTAGGRRQLATAGGGAVDMNTRTSLNLGSAPDGADRIDLISGEAVVTTAAGRAGPVVVVAGAGQTRAISAKFDVRFDGVSVCVTCLDGAVDVEHRGTVAVVREKQQVAYGPSGLGQVIAADPTVITSWQTGVLIFRRESLAHAVEEINRYRPGRIVLVDTSLGSKLIDASFRLDRMEDVVPQIERVFGARARSLPGGIVLLG